MTLAAETEQLETGRLILRRMIAADLDFFTEIHGDVDVARYIGSGQPRSVAETRTWFDDIQASYEASALGQLSVLRKADGVLIGRCGLSDAVLERNCRAGEIRKGWFFSTQAPTGIELEYLPELGYTFGKAHWGKGYASEAAGCVYDHVRAERRFAKIMSVIHRENISSRRVAQKFGVQLVDTVELSGRPFDRYHWPLESRNV